MNIRDTIGSILLLAFVGALTLLFWKEIPEANKDLIVYMLGQLSGFVAGVVAAHYTINSVQQRLDQQRVENTKAAFDAIKEQARGAGGEGGDALRPGDTVTLDTPPPENRT